MKNAMYRCGLLVAVLTLGGCQESPQTLLGDSLLNRPVATVYKVHADGGRVVCYRAPRLSATQMTRLRDGELVDLVSLGEGMRENVDGFWLHVYPPLSHRPSCYINVRNLIPYA